MAGKAALIRFAWVILTISSLTTARPSWGQVTGSAPPPVSSAQTLEVVVNGQPRAAVVIPRQADSWTRRAAGWVVEYVRKATGAELALVEEPASGTGGPRIAVGPTEMAKQAGLTVDNLKWDGCRLAVRGDVVFLLGRDEPPPSGRVDGHSGWRPADHIGARGSCRAVVEFLERFLGIRWLALGPNGEYVPSAKTLSVPSDLDVTVQPQFAYGDTVQPGLYLYGTDTPGAFANFYRTAVKRYQCWGSGHTWPEFITEEKYGKSHPDYFFFDGKKRHPDRFSHLCTTNPEVKEILIESIRAAFDQGYDWIQLGQSDGHKRCLCPRCEAVVRSFGPNPGSGIDASHAPRENPAGQLIFRLHHDIIEELAKSHPGKTLQLLSYADTTYPSSKFGRFGDNVVAEVCHSYESSLPAWRDKVRDRTVYLYWWGNHHGLGIGPKRSPHAVAKEIRLFRDQGVIGLYFCGGGECWGLEGPVYYAVGRLMGDPNRDVDALVKEYCDGLYGAAAPFMLAFFQELFPRLDAIQPLDKWQGADNNLENLSTVGFPPDVLRRLGQQLRAAEQAADSERARQWVKISRDTFDWVQLTAEMFHLYRAYQIEENSVLFRAIRKTVADRMAARERLLANESLPGINGIQSFFNSRSAGLERFRRAPETWDFPALERKFDASAGGSGIPPARLRNAIKVVPEVSDTKAMEGSRPNARLAH